MAAREDEAKPVVRLIGPGRRFSLQQRQLSPEARVPAQLVDGTPSGCRRQPGARSPWNAVPPPALQRQEQCVLDDLLGDVEVTEEPHQGAGEPPRLLPENRGQGRVSWARQIC